MSSARRQIEGIRSVRVGRVVRRLRAPGPLAFGRGLEITVHVDELAFEGASAFLLGSVLDRYFARHVSINSFTETVLRSESRGRNQPMGAAVGRETDALAFFAALAEAPYRYDFYQTLRRLECLYADKPRWGEALRPVDEPVRLGQDPDLSFAPAPLASFETDGGGPPRLQVRLFGLLGPNGPLPLHLTEYARERLRNAGDPTLSRFLDIFHHRFLALFYRAWAQAQPHVNRDRPKRRSLRRLRRRVPRGGAGGVSRPRRGAGPREVLSRRRAHPAGAERRRAGARFSSTSSACPCRSRSSSATGWCSAPRERTLPRRREGATLGAGAVLGGRVWDRQHKFRIRLGPLTLDAVRELSAGRRAARESWSTGSGCISASSSIGTSACS